VASKIASLIRVRGIALVVVSVVSALTSAKVGFHVGFWDGPG
jgi:hypothetical protein